MSHGILQARKLTTNDIELVQQMKTNIEDDYILRIFPDLVKSETNAVYGLFSQGILLSIGGYTLFPGGYAMLGRLRSDHRYLSKGHGTEILSYIKKELESDPSVQWFGANTNFSNKPARRVLEKLGFDQITKLHSLPVVDKTKLNGEPGKIWTEISTLEEKRKLLSSVKHNTLRVFPYECYYPFPFTQSLVTNEYLDQATFYKSHSGDRFMIIKNDRKGDWYAQVKYFWDDHFEQPGFWETVESFCVQQNEPVKAWIDFSEQGYQSIPDYSAFETNDAWVLYGSWKHKR